MGIRERKKRERERRRQQILVAAKRMFSDKGFSKTTMEDIAAEAELSPGTLYLYFKNKEELYASLTLRVLQYLLMRVEHVNDADTDDPEEKLAALCEAMYDIYQFDSMTIINMFHLQSSETLKNLSAHLLEEIDSLFGKSMEIMASIFAQGSAAGQFRQVDAGSLADIFWSLFSGVVLLSTSRNITGPDPEDLKSRLLKAFEVFHRGIATLRVP